MKSLKIVFILLVISVTILAKTIRINDDPKLDYDFHDEGTADTQKSVSNSSITFKEKELETEDNVIDMGETDKKTTYVPNSDKPTEAVTAGSDITCSVDVDKFKIKISKLMNKFVPDLLILKPVESGALAKVYLQNGKLMINRDYQIVGQPLCNQMDDKIKQYEIMVSFNNLMGSLDWKIYNLFGYNFSESALITVKSIITELVITENSVERTKLKDIKVGKIDGININVNIPQSITSVSYLKPMLEYIVSRITTIIANRSMDTISKHMRESFLQSIEEKTKINP